MVLPLVILSCLVGTLHAQKHTYTIKTLTGEEITSFLPFVAAQRIALFWEYPYLYEGTLSHEMTYLSWFSKLPHSAIAVAYEDDKPVGFASGTSFVDFDEHFIGSIQLFKQAGLQPKNYYYFPEVIVLPEHRGHGLNQQLTHVLELYAKSLGYTAGCLVTEDHDEHPLKPNDYQGYNWQKLGYTPSALGINFSWPTRQVDGTIREQEHTLMYWLKDLGA